MADTLNLSEIVQVDFPNNEYYREETPKNQIVLHHTVSSGKASGVINWWDQDPAKISTQFVVQDDGTIFQLYSSKYWAHHLGIKSSFLRSMGFADYLSRNTLLNKNSICIEICRWGGLMKDQTGFHPTYWDANLKKTMCRTKVTIPNENVQVFQNPYRGFYYFERYTQQQIESVRKLVIYLCDRWNIPKNYNADMWDISKNALGSKSGIYTHVSYRPDKSDLMPQPEVIAMLQGLEEPINRMSSIPFHIPPGSS